MESVEFVLLIVHSILYFSNVFANQTLFLKVELVFPIALLNNIIPMANAFHIVSKISNTIAMANAFAMMIMKDSMEFVFPNVCNTNIELMVLANV